MSGIDDLFPDAPVEPGVAVPAETAPSRSRRLGFVSLALGAFASAAIVGGILTAVSFAFTYGSDLQGGGGAQGDLNWVIPYEIAVTIGGIALAFGAFVTGFLAIRRNAGRRWGVAGLVLGGFVLLLELGTVILVLVAIGTVTATTF